MSSRAKGQTGQTALAMVITPDFVPGARVAVSSFLATNPWFQGDVVVIEPGQPCAAALADICPIITHAPSAALQKVLTQNSDRAKALYAKGEVLGLAGYDHVILADADLLFLGSIQPALSLATPLAAAPDRAQVLGQRRRASDYAETTDLSEPALGYTFCSGLLVFDGAHTGPQAHSAFLKAVRTVGLTRAQDGFRDQPLFNVLYADRVTPLGQDYNFMILAIDDMNVSLDAARVVHFNAVGKPWNPAQAAPYALSNAKAGQAYRLWAKAWKTVGAAPK